MRYISIRLIAVAAIVGVAAACSDTTTSPPLVRTSGVPAFARELPNCNATTLYQLSDMLSPTPARRSGHYELRGKLNHVLGLAKNKSANAQKAATDLANEVTDPETFRQFRISNVSRESAIESLVTELFACVGLGAVEFPDNWSRQLYGGVAFIGPEGGDLVTPDSGAAIRVPAGAVSSTHLFAIIPKWTATSNGEPACFTTQYEIVGQCYDLIVEPYTTFEVAVRLVICAEPDVPEKHSYVKTGVKHDSLPNVVYYDKLSDPFNLDCEGETSLPSSLLEPIEKLPPILIDVDYRIGSAAALLRTLASKAVSPFLPSIAYAADGVGSDLMMFSTAAVVYIPPSTDQPPVIH